jgi:peroxiredoxin
MSDSGTALPQVGSTLADFELPDTENRPRHLCELVQRGAAVIVFYRGHW